jgi:hypothetical protein
LLESTGGVCSGAQVTLLLEQPAYSVLNDVSAASACPSA